MRAGPLKVWRFFALWICLGAGPAFAWPPTFSAEFNFTNPEIMAQYRKLEDPAWIPLRILFTYRERWFRAIEAKCVASKQCRIERGTDHLNLRTYKVVYNDGWYYEITLDPGVIEIKTKKATVAELRKMRDRIQTDIFDLAKDTLGLKAIPNASGRHLHMGTESAFGGNDKLFRNFAVDTINHPELFQGFFGYAPGNAPPLGDLGPEARTKFGEAIALFDGGKIRGIQPLAQAIQTMAYLTHPFGWDPAYKYQAFNVSRTAKEGMAVEDQTVEFRPYFGNGTIDDFIDDAALLEGRIEYLKLRGGTVEYLGGANHQTVQEGVDALFDYVTQSGQDYERFHRRFPKKFRWHRPRQMSGPIHCPFEGV